MKANRAFSLKNLVLFIAVVLISVSAANAQKSFAPLQNSLTYAGTVDGHMNFLLNYDNELGEKFFVLIPIQMEKYFSKKFTLKKSSTESSVFQLKQEILHLPLQVSRVKTRKDFRLQLNADL